MGSGMEETYQLTAALKHLEWGKEVALVTDARFSGVSTGACIGHMVPEAYAGGGIGALITGDLLWLPKHSRRSFRAGDGGLSYLTVHTHREPTLAITPR